MQNFSFKCPTEIVFGRGAEEQVADKLRAYGASRIFVLYGGGSVVKSGLLSKVERTLLASGLAFQVMGGVQPVTGTPGRAHGVCLPCRFHPGNWRWQCHRFGQGNRPWYCQSRH